MRVTLDGSQIQRLLTCAAAALLAATPARAGDGGNTGFQIQLVADRTVLTPENPTATVTLMMGTFGQGGAGPYGFRGLVTAGQPLESEPGGAPPPFEAWIEEQLDPSSIDLLIVREIVVQPPPPAPPPPPYGVDEFVPAYVFTVSASDFSSQSSVLVSAAGEGNSITEWRFLLGVSLWGPETGPLEAVATELQILIVPAPPVWGACLLMLGLCRGHRTSTMSLR